MEKKCLLASTVMHGSLVMLLVFGSAFLSSAPKKQEFPRMRVVPHTLVDDALAGGGGNPNIPMTDDVQKGETLTPQPPAPAPAPTPTPQPPVVQPVPPAPTPTPPKPVIRKPDPKPAPPKPDPVKIAKPVKPEPKAPEKTPDLKDLLKPIVRTSDDKAKAKAEAEAREAAREAARAESAYQSKLAKAFGGATSTLREGFASGTKVDVGGPGGAAYADYLAYVEAIYRDAWDRTLPQDLLADDSTSLVSVTIARSGRVINSRVVRKSGDSSIDRLVQKTISRVTAIGHPFPRDATDEERTFTIELNFRKRRAAG